MRFGLQSYALSFSAWQIFLNLVDYQRPAPPARPDLVITGVTTASKAAGGDIARVTATVANQGAADSAASTTAFTVDGNPLGTASTAAIPAGGSVAVSIDWPTGGIKGDHVLGAAADGGTAIDESNEGNNGATLAVSVKGNRVTNGSFEGSNAAGTGPEGWQGQSTGAGSTSWSTDAEGDRSASMSGTNKSAALLGAPTWTSVPIAVTPGEALTLSVDISCVGLSSAPSVGLVYLNALGQVLGTVSLAGVPKVTSGFTTLTQSVTVPANASQLRIVLTGFSATDLRTAGTVTFDNVRLE
jgi:hypothetical protein